MPIVNIATNETFRAALARAVQEMPPDMPLRTKRGVINIVPFFRTITSMNGQDPNDAQAVMGNIINFRGRMGRVESLENFLDRLTPEESTLLESTFQTNADEHARMTRGAFIKLASSIGIGGTALLAGHLLRKPRAHPSEKPKSTNPAEVAACVATFAIGGLGIYEAETRPNCNPVITIDDLFTDIQRLFAKAGAYYLQETRPERPR